MEPQPDVTQAGASSCDYLDCSRDYGYIIYSGEVNQLLKQATTRQKYPHILLLCREHYRKLRTKDGYTLGFHKRHGRIEAYVKMEHF